MQTVLALASLGQVVVVQALVVLGSGVLVVLAVLGWALVALVVVVVVAGAVVPAAWSSEFVAAAG